MSQHNDERIMTSIPVLREACDACHRRKMRCPAEGVGACLNCRRAGQVCQYSPRSEMGRPRRTSPTRRRTTKKSNDGKGKNRAYRGLQSASSQLALHESNMVPESSNLQPEETAPAIETRYSASDGYQAISSSPQPLFSDHSSIDLSLLSGLPVGNSESWPYTTMESFVGTPESITPQTPDPDMAYPSDEVPYLHHTSAGTSAAVPNHLHRPQVPTQTPLPSLTPTRPRYSISEEYYEAYSQLYSILNTLQTFSSGMPKIDGHALQTCQVFTLDQIFEQVSILCGMVTWLSRSLPPISPRTRRNIMTSPGRTEENSIDRTELLQLIISLVSTVLGIYGERLVKYRGLCVHFKLGGFTTKSISDQEYCLSFFPQDTKTQSSGSMTPQHQIQILTNAATMEYHLGALKRGLKDVVPLGICDESTLVEVEGLGKEVKEFVDLCRHGG